MTNKYTPAPWFCIESHVDNGNIWISTPLDYIGEVYSASLHYEITEEQAQTNANLIAAAPELLEALELCLSCTEMSLDDIDESTQEAINKARGIK